MRFAAVIVLGLICFANVEAAEPKLQATKLLDGKLTVSIPAGFKQLDKEMIAKKYPGENAPNIVFASDDGAVSIAVNHTENRMTLKQLAEAREPMAEGFKKLHPTCKFFRNESTKIGGRECFIFDVRTPAVDTDIRNVMLGTSLDDRFLIVTFNCTKELEGKWLTTGKKIIDGMRVKEVAAK